MKGTSKNQPKSIIDFKPGYQIRWNIQPYQTADNETHYEYDCNVNYIPQNLTRKEIILAIIREKYDENDELALSFNRAENETEIKEHEDYVNMAKEIAESIVN